MKTIESLYAPLRKITSDLLLLSHKSNMPVVVYDALRTPTEQAAIYPDNPTRFSLHLVGLAVDFYPAEFRSWPRADFRRRFDEWKHWGALSDMSVSCGFDIPQAWQKADRPHCQKLFGHSESMIKTIYKNAKTDKLKTVWQYLDLHRGTP